MAIAAQWQVVAPDDPGGAPRKRRAVLAFSHARLECCSRQEACPRRRLNRNSTHPSHYLAKPSTPAHYGCSPGGLCRTLGGSRNPSSKALGVPRMSWLRVFIREED